MGEVRAEGLIGRRDRLEKEGGLDAEFQRCFLELCGLQNSRSERSRVTSLARWKSRESKRNIRERKRTANCQENFDVRCHCAPLEGGDAPSSVTRRLKRERLHKTRLKTMG